MRAGFRLRKLKERDRVSDIGVDGRIVLKWILKKQSDTG